LTPKEQEQADKKKQRQDEMRQRIAEQKGLRDQEAAAGPEPEEEFKPTVDGGKIREAFKEHYKNALKRNKLDLKSHVKRVATTEAFSTDLADIIYSIEEEGFKVDPGEFKKAVARSFGINVDNYPGWDSEIKSGAAQEPSSPEAPAPSAAPTETAAAPEPAEGAAPETEEAPTAAPEAPKEEEEAPAPAPEPEAPAAGPSEEKAPKPAQSKRTRAETQEIQKRGSEELAKTQETNRKLEAMTKRMANSPLVKNEEMRNWINNDLDRLLKSFTPAEKTEDPWEQDGPEATGIPEPTAQAPASQKALAGQPGPKGLLSPGKEPPVSKKKRTRAETQEIQKRGSEELAKTQETNRKLEAMTQRMANSSAVKNEEMRNWINNDLDRLLKSFTPAEKTEDPWEQDGPEATGIPEPAAQAPASQKALAGQPGPKGLLSPGKEPQAPPPASGRRTKAEGDEIRRRGQETLEQIQRGASTEKRMANSPVARREDEINEKGQQALEEIQREDRKPAPRTRRTATQGREIRREGSRLLDELQGKTPKPRRRPVLDRVARSLGVRNKPGNISNNAEYQEFAQSIRSMMR